MKEIDEGMSGIDIKFVLGKIDYYVIKIFEMVVYIMMILTPFSYLTHQNVNNWILSYFMLLSSIVIKNICVKAD